MRFILMILATTFVGTALAEEQQAPFWLAKIKVECENTITSCLGAIIEDNYLITTASCVNMCDDSERIINISVSDYSATGSKQFDMRITETEVIIHPEFNIFEGQKLHDVALVKFECTNFELDKVSLLGSCSKDVPSLSVITINETSYIYSAHEASIAGRKRRCKNAYEKWDGSQQVCIIASSCSDKEKGLITDDQHDVLYAFPVYASVCNNKKENTIIAASELCKYHEWITNRTTTDAQCLKVSITPSIQIITTTPTTATTSTTIATTTTTIATTSTSTASTSTTTATTSTATAVVTSTPTPTRPKPSGCSPPANIMNGSIRYVSLSRGSTARYSCDRGYVMDGKKKTKCIGSSWNSDPPTCNPKTCGPPPKIENGKETFTGMHYGSKATYQCNPGYEMQGTDTLICEASGKWSRNVPTCNPGEVASRCSDPPLPHKMNVNISEDLIEGATASYSCPDRYKLEGDNVLTCKNGKWAGEVPYCKDCPDFGTVSNAQLTKLNITSYLSVQIKCDEGYTIKGEPANYCVRGEWRHPKATCDANACPTLENIPNGSVRYTGFTFRSLAIYQCNSRDYILIGFQRRQCKNDGTWAGSPPVCRPRNEVFCKQYGRISCGSTSNTGGLGIGATVTYTPDSDAQLMGPSKITCLSNGSWSAPTPICRMMCDMSFTLENGNYKLIMNNATPDYEMEMTCDEGYEMSGVQLFLCRNGVWNGVPSQTKCARPCTCPTIQNGKAQCTSDSGFFFITVTCNDGYTLKGTSPAVCQGGTYFSPVPTCV